MSGLGDLPRRVTIYEVGPRDGLQNEPGVVPLEAKIRFINLLSAAHLPVVEVTSFVRPGMIPQLSDAEAVLAGIERLPNVLYTALIPNSRGMDRADGAALGGVAVFTSASETFSVRNTNASIDETLERFRPIVRRAREDDMWVRGYVSAAFGCPYEGSVTPAAVLRVSSALLNLGVDEIAVSDTIGIATPGEVMAVVDALVGSLPVERLALHFHDTRGTALANVMTGLQLGITTYDASAGGLGGCPYAPGASGNLATEDLVYLLNGLGIETGVSLADVVKASAYLAGITGRQPPSRYFRSTS